MAKPARPVDKAPAKSLSTRTAPANSRRSSSNTPGTDIPVELPPGEPNGVHTVSEEYTDGRPGDLDCWFLYEGDCIFVR